MIKVLTSDTIVDVVNKMNECSDKEYFLEFPFWHNILNNYLSLKILKNKAWEKRITILTHDLTSKKIWAPLGIHYSLIKDSEFHKEKTLNQEILKHNFTFWEYMIFTIKQYFTRFIQFIGKKAGINTLKYYNPYNTVKKSWLFFLFLWLFTSIGMLFFIFYFAVSKTYIEVIPEINIKTKAINITYEELPDSVSALSNNLNIPIKKISQTVWVDYTHKTTGIDYENTSRAHGQVELINELREEQTFRPKTRLLSSNGLIFETQDWVKIPGVHYDGSGTLVFGRANIEVIARVNDVDGGFVGEKGNLKIGNLFTIPGLKFNQDKIYARSINDFTWGDNKISYIIGEDDEANAKKVLEEMLKKEALNALKQKIGEDNKMYGTENEILGIPDIIQYKNLSITSEPKELKVGEKREDFKLHGTITLNTYIYNKNSVLTLMKNIINDSLLSGTDKLIMIDNNSLRMSVILDQTTSPLRIKATTEVNIGLSYDFDNNTNNYTQRLKSLILWLSNDEAKNILLNEERISNIKIKNTPFFIHTVSSNSDNIILRIGQE